MSTVVLDIAGATMGGAARWVTELDGFLADAGAAAPITVIGRQRALTAGWLARRERHAVGAGRTVAANNVSFGFAGADRRVVLRNALHFLHPSEEHLLTSMSRSFRAQIPVVRRLLARADLVVVPCATMAERVRDRVPALRHRIAIRPHPVTPVGPRLATSDPYILVPVLPAPYKNLVPQLASLVAALDRTGLATEVRVTAHPADLPEPIVRHPRLVTLGTVPHRTLAGLWQRAGAAYFPSAVESFGYPLAEARAYGVPVLAPDTAQAREIAGPALVPYRRGDLGSLEAAVRRLTDPVPAEPDAFDRDSYFRWLLALPAGRRHLTATQEFHATGS